MTYIVKRGWKIEPYSSAKLKSSVEASCLSVRTAPGEAEMTSRLVAARVEEWLKNRPEVTSSDIRRKSAESLVAYNAEAAYMYIKQAKHGLKRKQTQLNYG